MKDWRRSNKKNIWKNTKKYKKRGSEEDIWHVLHYQHTVRNISPNFSFSFERRRCVEAKFKYCVNQWWQTHGPLQSHPCFASVFKVPFMADLSIRWITQAYLKLVYSTKDVTRLGRIAWADTLCWKICNGQCEKIYWRMMFVIYLQAWWNNNNNNNNNWFKGIWDKILWNGIPFIS
jgi:hypothetical protein